MVWSDAHQAHTEPDMLKSNAKRDNSWETVTQAFSDIDPCIAYECHARADRQVATTVHISESLRAVVPGITRIPKRLELLGFRRTGLFNSRIPGILKDNRID